MRILIWLSIFGKYLPFSLKSDLDRLSYVLRTVDPNRPGRHVQGIREEENLYLRPWEGRKNHYFSASISTEGKDIRNPK